MNTNLLNFVNEEAETLESLGFEVGEYLKENALWTSGAEIVLSYGGPTIWIDTENGLICGSWADDYESRELNRFTAELIRDGIASKQVA